MYRKLIVLKQRVSKILSGYQVLTRKLMKRQIKKQNVMFERMNDNDYIQCTELSFVQN